MEVFLKIRGNLSNVLLAQVFSSVNFHVNGPACKASQILNIMIDQFINFNITEDQFISIREQALRDLVNQLKRPSNMLFDIYHFTFDSVQYSGIVVVTLLFKSFSGVSLSETNVQCNSATINNSRPKASCAYDGNKG